MGKAEELTPEETDRNIEMWKIKRVRGRPRGGW